MEKQFEEIREQQRASWSRASSGWGKWDELIMRFLAPVGDELVNELQLKGTEVVLDVASGTGEPGLSIAARLPSGKVVLSDLSEDMLEIAMANARRKGIRNIEVHAGDVCNLAFQDNTFDALSCRFGFMFFPDVLLAAKEMYRVLKPGGKIVTSVWNVPEKNLWVTTLMDVIHSNIGMPAPVPEIPGVFRCAGDGYLINLFIHAGFKNIQIGEVKGTLDLCSAEQYWEMMTEAGAPVIAALNEADPALIAKIRYEVYESLDQQYKRGDIQMGSSTLLLSAQKS
jgi:SAM-dependent methyltransferase